MPGVLKFFDYPLKCQKEFSQRNRKLWRKRNTWHLAIMAETYYYHFEKCFYLSNNFEHFLDSSKEKNEWKMKEMIKINNHPKKHQPYGNNCGIDGEMLMCL